MKPLLLALAAALPLALPSVASAQYVMNHSHCLTEESSFGGTVTLRNNCARDLEVTFCWGTYSCENVNGTGAVRIRANNVNLVSRDDELRHRALIAFACDAEVKFDDCHKAKQDHFRNRNPDGPRR